jgi:glycosyltransferase involved in cell wall biosynthesis
MTDGRGLRIVHICPRYPPAPGGAELFFSKLSAGLARAGHDVEVWTTTARSVDAFTSSDPGALPAGSSRDDGVTVRRYPLWHPPLRRYLLTALHPLPFGRTWKAATLRWNPLALGLSRHASAAVGPVDVVHGAALPYSLLLDAAVRLADRTGARLVLTPFAHLGDPTHTSNKIRRVYLSKLNVGLLRAADVVLVQTRAEYQALADAGVDASRLRVVGMGVDPAECTNGDRQRGRDRWGLGDEVVVGHLANKSADKGTVDLLEASARAWAGGARFRLLLAGEDMQSFRTFWRRYRHQDRVVNLGILTAQERRDFFAAIDVFALPSYVESFGISLLEAGSNGLPAVAYRLGGPAEILKDGTTGRLVGAGDVAALSRVMTDLACDGAERRRLGTAAIEAAGAWTWDRVLNVVMREYQGGSSRLAARDRSRSAAAYAPYSPVPPEGRRR